MLRKNAPNELRRLNIQEAEAVFAIEAESSPAPWSLAQVRQELTQNISEYWGLWQGQQLLAFAGFWLVAGEVQLVNIAVQKSCRRQGLGKALLKKLMESARSQKAHLMTLEVRQGNGPARRLYESLGFCQTSERINYYEGRETAVLMETHL